MFLILSKITGWFIVPANWLLALLIWWLLTKNNVRKKRIGIALVALLFLFGNGFLFVTVVNWWQPAPVQLQPSYEAGILLGGSTSFDKENRGFLNTTADRVFTISELYHTGIIKKIIVSAGTIDKDKPVEAFFLVEKLKKQGIPDADIIPEGRSRTTFENALFTKQTIEGKGLKPPYVLVTSAMHMPRALRVFRKAGLQVVAYPCNYTVLPRRFGLTDFLLPQPDVINGWATLLKEMVGVAGYSIFGKA